MTQSGHGGLGLPNLPNLPNSSNEVDIIDTPTMSINHKAVKNDTSTTSHSLKLNLSQFDNLIEPSLNDNICNRIIKHDCTFENLNRDNRDNYENNMFDEPIIDNKDSSKNSINLNSSNRVILSNNQSWSSPNSNLSFSNQDDSTETLKIEALKLTDCSTDSSATSPITPDHQPPIDLASNAILGYETYLNNISYNQNYLQYLNERIQPLKSPKDMTDLNDFKSISSDLIPGYTLLKKFGNKIETPSLIMYTAVKNSDSIVKHENTTIEKELNSNVPLQESSSNYLIRMSTNLMKNFAVTRFLNEWYILSGLNTDSTHHVFSNERNHNNYLPKARSTQYDKNDIDGAFPVTLPRNVPGILYPIKALTVNTNNGNADYITDSSVITSTNDVNQEQLESIPQQSEYLVDDEGLRIHENPNSTIQKRFALVYPNNDYKTIRDVYVSTHDENVVNFTRNRSSSSLNTMSTMSSSNTFGSLVNSPTLNKYETKRAKSVPKSPFIMVQILHDILKIMETISLSHDFNVVHNGITSTNILKSETDINDVKLMGWDFCFSIQPEDCTNAFRKQHLTQIADLLPYISPETTGEYNRSVDYRSDFYSIGIVLYELILGTLPFQSDDPSKVMRMHIIQKPIAPSILGQGWVSDELSNVILKCLEKNPCNRYINAKTLISDLGRIKNQYLDKIVVSKELTEQYPGETFKVYTLERDCGQLPTAFLPPRGIYGRAADFKSIVDTFEGFGSGLNTILITGESGSGKSKLINELRSTAISKLDFYTYWKYNEHETLPAYSSLIHGIKMILKDIISSPAEVIHIWRNLIVAKIPLELSFMFDSLPQLKTLLGQKYSQIVKNQKESMGFENSNEQSLNLELKFRYAIKFIYTLFASHGITIFLDDSQWCTAQEWAIIEEILTLMNLNNEHGDKSIKMVLAYSNDSEASTLSRERIITSLQDMGINLREISLQSLSRDQFLKYIYGLLYWNYPMEGDAIFSQFSANSIWDHNQGSFEPDDGSIQIATRLFDITGGSILYSQFLITSAALCGRLRMKDTSFGVTRWDVEIDPNINTKESIIDNYFQSALDDEAISLLKFASIIRDGISFNLADLIIVSNMSLRKVYTLLQKCVEARLISPTSAYYKVPYHILTSEEFPFHVTEHAIWTSTKQTKYSFSHDTLHERLISEMTRLDELQQYHRLCGLRHYEKLSKSEATTTDYLTMAHHFSRSVEAVKPDEEAIYVGILVQAGRISSATCSLETGLSYFLEADKLVKVSDKLDKLKGLITICQNFYLLEDVDKCLEFIDFVQSEYGYDDSIFLLTRIRCLADEGNIFEALEVAVNGLKYLGVEASLEESLNELKADRLKGKVSLSIRDIRNMKNLRPATNPKCLLIFELISDIIYLSYQTKHQNLRYYLFLEAILLMRSSGVSAYGATVFLAFANKLAKTTDKGDFMRAIEFSKLTLSFVAAAENVPYSYIQGIYEIFITTMAIFMEEIADIVKYYDLYINNAKSFVHSRSSTIKYCTSASRMHLAFISGDFYDSTDPSARDRNNSVEKLKYNKLINFDILETNGYALLQGEISLAEYDRRFDSANERLDYKFCYYACKLYYLKAHKKYREAADLIFSHLDRLSSLLPNTLVHIDYYSICFGVLIQFTPKDMEEEELKKRILEKIMKMFHLWTDICPSAFKVRYKLILTLGASKDQSISSLDVLDMFEETIELAKEVRCWYDVGWSSYVCANWLLDIDGSKKRVAYYLRQALVSFKRIDIKLMTGILQDQIDDLVADSSTWGGILASKGKKDETSSNNLTLTPTYIRLLNDENEMTDAKTSLNQTFKPPRLLSITKTRVPTIDDESNYLNKAVQACLAISEASTNTGIVANLLENTILLAECDYGVVVLQKENNAMIRAIGTSEQVYDLHNEPLSSRRELCPNILLNHILVHGSIVTNEEDHVFFSNMFSKDEYFQESIDSAIICIPLKSQTGVFGALYLEKNKGLDSMKTLHFHSKIRDLLNLLCTQSAVSLTKARLYSHMEIAKKVAEEATTEKASFLANMSHEIRTPFNSLLSCSIFLLDTPLNKTQIQYVETIKDSAMVTLNIIDGILAFSKIEHGSFTLDNAPFSLNECIESAIQLSGEQAAANDVELAYFNKCPQIDTILGDVTRFRQIIINLVGNSVKFTQSGYIIVEVKAKQIFDDRYEITISVEDTGIGIPEGSRNKVFGAFSQVDGSSRRVFGGSGLGLAISKKLCDIMGGSISYESKEDEGSKFKVVISSKAKILDEPEVYFGVEEAKKRDNINKALIIDTQWHRNGSLKEMLQYFGMNVEIVDQVDQVNSQFDDFSMIFIQFDQFYQFHNCKKSLRPNCQIVIIVNFGKPLPDDIEKFQVMLCPFQRGKVVDLIKNLLPDKFRRNSTTRISPKSILQAELASKYPLNILLAEDNVVNTKVAIQHLKKFGYVADHAKDGEVVIEKCQMKLDADEPMYDAILMDIQMPRKDGIEATIELKELFKSQNKLNVLPYVVALTANVAGDDKQKSLSCGMIDFISKPILPAELSRVLVHLGEKVQQRRNGEVYKFIFTSNPEL